MTACDVAGCGKPAEVSARWWGESPEPQAGKLCPKCLAELWARLGPLCTLGKADVQLEPIAK